MKVRRRSGDRRTAFDAISAPSAAFDVLSFAGSSEVRRLALRLLVTNTHVALCQLYWLLVGGEGSSHARKARQRRKSVCYLLVPKAKRGGAVEWGGHFTLN